MDPIADVATFNTIVESVITTNPFAYGTYMTTGQSNPPVEKTRETYTVKVVYQDTGNCSNRVHLPFPTGYRHRRNCTTLVSGRMP
jgi:hypothetical protein